MHMLINKLTTPYDAKVIIYLYCHSYSYLFTYLYIYMCENFVILFLLNVVCNNGGICLLFRININ